MEVPICRGAPLLQKRMRRCSIFVAIGAFRVARLFGEEIAQAGSKGLDRDVMGLPG